jgi:protein-S-isoprenylcysteine O-methyltransferase Ste14
MHALELKIPPPVVAALLGWLVWLAGRWLPLEALLLPADWRLVFALLCGAAGVTLDLVGLVTFRRARTTFNPLRPSATSALVEHGIYRRTRNPMYVGQLLALLGWLIWVGHPMGVLAPVALVAYVTRFQIRPEERVLQAKFGDAFSRYRARVPRWW